MSFQSIYDHTRLIQTARTQQLVLVSLVEYIEQGRIQSVFKSLAHFGRQCFQCAIPLTANPRTFIVGIHFLSQIIVQELIIEVLKSGRTLIEAFLLVFSFLGQHHAAIEIVQTSLQELIDFRELLIGKADHAQQSWPTDIRRLWIHPARGGNGFLDQGRVGLSRHLGAGEFSLHPILRPLLPF